MVQPQTFLVSVNQALDGMLKIVEELGDEHINQRPDLPEANTPYAIMTHCVGLTHYWIGRVCTGRPYDRDRDAEFSAHGSLAEMRQAVRSLQQQLSTDIQQVHMDQPIVGELQARHTDLHGISQAEVMMRCFKELAQHHGHLDMTRDLLLRS